MIAKRETCADKDKSVCDYNEFRRLRYFHGMLLDDKDFQAEQDYHTNKRRFLNRMLHGSGVVCGLDVNGKKGGRGIEITSGLAFDCSGNEIWVPRTTTIDLASVLPKKDKGNQLECEEDAGPDKLTSYWIGIRYDEKGSNPVSVYLPSGSCEERTCENSRYKEGYCIELLKDCPKKTEEAPSPGLLESFCLCETTPDFDKDYEELCGECDGLQGKALCKCRQLEKFCETSVPCPECCSCDKCCHVVLGKIEVDKECRLQSICINDCRSYILTGHLLKHMIRGVFAGTEKYLELNGEEVKGLTASNIADNPIRTLCWALRNLVVEEGKLKFNLCDKKEAAGEDFRNEVAILRKNLADSNREVATFKTQMQRVIALNNLKFEPVDNVPAVPADAAPDTQSPATKPEAAPAETPKPSGKTPKGSPK